MRRFAALFEMLDQTTKTNVKVAALAHYFEQAPKPDRLWAIALLSHKRPKRTVTTTLLRSWAADVAGLPLWLFEESYHIAGDLAEAIALVLPKAGMKSENTLTAWIQILADLKDKDDAEKKRVITDAWSQLTYHERFVFNKIITGGFRVGVSQKLMTRALSKATGIEESVLAHRLMGKWSPVDTTFDDLIFNKQSGEALVQPYPFYLAYALDRPPSELGPSNLWQAEYKWDGIRGQLILRGGHHFLWSRGEDLISQSFPEFEALREKLDYDVVIDGEVLPYQEGRPLGFQALQKRLGRKKVSRKMLEAFPVILMAYDLLEYRGKDIREMPLHKRRALLEKVVLEVDSDLLKISSAIPFSDFKVLDARRQDARASMCEGIMLKKLDSVYQVGRKKGSWWKWKIDPLKIDAVMLYAQQGHGRRANLFTDYTFAVWKGDELVPFAKAYSGLTDAEFLEVTRFVRENTLDRYGPVRAVRPTLVFELAFEGIQPSTRHKSGIALRFPRIHRWRKDKHPKEANTLSDLKDMLDLYG